MGVWGRNNQPPEPQDLALMECRSWERRATEGLFLVEALSREWGCYATPAVKQHTAVIGAEGQWEPPAFLHSRSLLTVGEVMWPSWGGLSLDSPTVEPGTGI